MTVEQAREFVGAALAGGARGCSKRGPSARECVCKLFHQQTLCHMTSRAQMTCVLQFSE
jgi:hypothetical protein